MTCAYIAHSSRRLVPQTVQLLPYFMTLQAKTGRQAYQIERQSHDRGRPHARRYRGSCRGPKAAQACGVQTVSGQDAYTFPPASLQARPSTTDATAGLCSRVNSASRDPVPEASGSIALTSLATSDPSIRAAAPSAGPIRSAADTPAGAASARTSCRKRALSVLAAARPYSISLALGL